MLKIDPLENMEEYKEIFAIVNSEVEKELANKGIKMGIGYIHKFDALKKEILLTKYNIVWHTTAEMNPDIRID